jgi:hypothetical protein
VIRIRDVLAAAAVLAVSAQPAIAGADVAAPALVLSVEDVRAIAGNADLSPGPSSGQPVGQHQYDAQYPGECHAVFNQDDAFASGFTQVHTVTYTGPANRSVTQAVAVYPGSADARSALTRLGKQLTACSQLPSSNMTITTQVLDSKTFAVCQAQCSTIYRAVGPVLIGVDASRFGDSDRIATAVLAQITGRADAA